MYPCLVVGLLLLSSFQLVLTSCPSLSSNAIAIACYEGIYMVSCLYPWPVGYLAEFVCMPRNTNSDEVTIRRLNCTDSGEWGRPSLSCLPVTSCPPLSSYTTTIACSSRRREVNCAQSWPIGFSIEVACKPGHFTSDGVPTRRINCADSGEWDRPLLSCRPVTSCPPLSTNTTTIACYSRRQEVDCAQPLPKGSSVQVTCKPGYTTYDGVPTRRLSCTDSGQWNRPVLNCLPVTSCPLTLSSFTTAIACSSRGQEVNCAQPLPTGSSIEVTCKPGYITSDEDTNRRLYCTDSGQWDRPVLNCRPVTSCPPLSSNTTTVACYSRRRREVDCAQPGPRGSSIEVACKPGYTTSDEVSSRTLYCTDSGQWNRPVLSCVPETYCPPLSTNTTTIACSSRGQEVDCAQPWLKGSSVEVACRPGYITSDEVTTRRLNCTDSGQWDLPVLSCLPETYCPPLSSITTTVTCSSRGQEVDCAQPQPKRSSIEVACKPGYFTSDGVPTRRLNCTDSGQWDRPVLSCLPVTSCPPYSSNKTTMGCYSKDQEVNCAQPRPVGSWIEVACKPGYIISGEEVTIRRINCTTLGEWDLPSLKCRPDCGRRNTNDGGPSLPGGDTDRVNEFPWHVVIYEKVGDSNVQICGGSLISTRVVVSAAYCFWNEKDDIKKVGVYKVAAGKRNRAWLDAEDDHLVQRRRVQNVTVAERYHARSSSFQSDIALVRLSAGVELTANVNLVCVNWKKQWEQPELQKGDIGLIPGWGFKEQGQLSSVLKYVEMPFVEHLLCYEAIDEALLSLLTLEKFCAGYDSPDINTCSSDTGNGLVFLNDTSNRYYLQGVLSNAFKLENSNDLCFSRSYSPFTDVSKYIEWIRKHRV